MISKEKNWHIICYSSYKHKILPELKKYISSDLLKNICKNLDEKTIIVLWWDWTMLRAIKHHYKSELPFLWINFWNKWFLLNEKKYITEKSNFEKVFYPIMTAKVSIWSKKYNDIFINELNISAWWWKMLDLTINLSNKNKINIKWDWIVICTPTGSTWYNSSLKWPIIPHNIPVLAITSKAPWYPRNQHPIIISDNQEIQIIRNGRLSCVECYTDSRELYNWNDENIIIWVKKHTKKIFFLIDEKYKKNWDNKVLIEQGFQ